MPRLHAGRLSPQFRDVITHDVEKEGEVLYTGGKVLSFILKGKKRGHATEKIAFKKNSRLDIECNQN